MENEVIGHLTETQSSDTIIEMKTNLGASESSSTGKVFLF